MVDNINNLTSIIIIILIGINSNSFVILLNKATDNTS
ncbi:hypothetical protein Catovirus_1_528 [Catovirus CTV1]|uniref:Uncharacterized protein n=1 Tax=Catovirus CTV1 TaxID=1977631 RepID=A0A1V0S9Z6_9VIRU|nr:hypothetical protein Catovirus_1_528 [Catovirus CTV1]